MKSCHKLLGPSLVTRLIGGFSLLSGLFAACCAMAQTPAPARKPLEVTFRALCRGRVIENGATVPAGAKIYLSPAISTLLVVRAGDVVNIDFLDGTNELCSSKAVWHDGMNPTIYRAMHPGATAVPQIVVPAGFAYTGCVWSNAPAGSHVLTAHSSVQGLSAVSAPLSFTIAPSPATGATRGQ